MRFTMVNFVYLIYTIVKGFYLSKLLSVTSTIVRIRRLIWTNFFFARRVVQKIVLPQSIVSLVEAMYQSAFREAYI